MKLTLFGFQKRDEWLERTEVDRPFPDLRMVDFEKLCVLDVRNTPFMSRIKPKKDCANK